MKVHAECGEQRKVVMIDWTFDWTRRRLKPLRQPTNTEVPTLPWKTLAEQNFVGFFHCETASKQLKFISAEANLQISSRPLN